jgi:HTH-type transcriptional regulator/antitoxin HigA
VTTNYDPNKYGKLLIDVAPGAIESEEENERVLGVIERLMRRGEGNLSPEEDRMLRMLVVLVEDFEEKAYPIGPPNPAVALRELMREHRLKQTDMVEIFGSQGTVSQVLNGKLDISKSQAKKLSARFHLPVDIFI